MPKQERGRYQTLIGMMMLLTGRPPQVADTAQWEGWRFEIVDMDGKTIDKVLASWLTGRHRGGGRAAGRRVTVASP